MKDSQYDFRVGTRRDEGDGLTPKLIIGVNSKKFDVGTARRNELLEVVLEVVQASVSHRDA